MAVERLGRDHDADESTNIGAIPLHGARDGKVRANYDIGSPDGDRVQPSEHDQYLWLREEKVAGRVLRYGVRGGFFDATLERATNFFAFAHASDDAPPTRRWDP